MFRVVFRHLSHIPRKSLSATYMSASQKNTKYILKKCASHLNLLLTIKIVLRNVSFSMCLLVLPTFQSDWYYQQSPLGEQVLRQQGTWAWGCYVRAMVSATDP